MSDNVAETPKWRQELCNTQARPASVSGDMISREAAIETALSFPPYHADKCADALRALPQRQA